MSNPSGQEQILPQTSSSRPKTCWRFVSLLAVVAMIGVTSTILVELHSQSTRKVKVPLASLTPAGEAFSHELTSFTFTDDDEIELTIPERKLLFSGGSGWGGSSCTSCGGSSSYGYSSTSHVYSSPGLCQAAYRGGDFYKYKNKNGIVHVIHTRFMLHQGELVHLARARMELMRTFTLPSMKAQSLDQYLWIIWVDPNLAGPIKCELKTAISKLHNVVVVAWDGRYTEDFRSFDWATNIEDHHLWHGTKQTLLSWHDQSMRRVLLETRLDADDALHCDFVKNIQKQAKNTIKKSKDKSDYLVFCSESHMEWRYFSDNEEEAPEAHGRFLDLETPSFCVTPGLSIGYQVQASVADLKTVQQCKIHREIAPCGGKVKKRCLRRIDMGKSPLPYVSLRPRSPVDHGMKHVMPNYAEPWPATITQEDAVKILYQAFGIDCANIYKARAQMELFLDLILQDAYKGQCTPGHSCKAETKRKLEELMWQSGSSLYYY